jgi:hypothetical protein
MQAQDAGELQQGKVGGDTWSEVSGKAWQQQTDSMAAAERKLLARPGSFRLEGL